MVLSAAATLLKGIVDWFVVNVPQPVKILLFLFMIGTIGLAVPVLLNATGFHCTSNGDLYQRPVTGLVTNIDLIIKRAEAQETCNPVEETTILRQKVPATCVGSTIVDCTNCTPNADDDNCTTNGYRLESYSLFKYPACFNPFGHCAPPVDWFFNYTHGSWETLIGNLTGEFQCIKGSSPLCNETALCESFNDDVTEDSTFIPLPTGAAADSLDNMVSIGCDGLEPQVQVFNRLNLFDFQLWAMLAITGFVFALLTIIQRFRR